MDDNKLKKLLAETYRITRCCGLCKHGQFQPSQDFGTCSAITYEHQKHSESSRDLSIHRFGRCLTRFETDKDKVARLGAYTLFLKE